MIIHVLTTSAAERDIQRTLGIEAALTRQGLPPAQHLVDAGYVGADELTQSQLQYGIELVGPIQSDGQWQAKAGEGYDVSRFVIDWDTHQASCPQGKRSRQWVEQQRAGTPLISIKFAPKECRACPVRAHCTKAQGRGRTITVHSQREHEMVQEARQRQMTGEFHRHYAQRAGIEGTFSHGTRVANLRPGALCGGTEGPSATHCHSRRA